jgi:hypothetical protein
MLTEKAPGCAIVADSPGFLADTRPAWRFLGGFEVLGSSAPNRIKADLRSSNRTDPNLD